MKAKAIAPFLILTLLLSQAPAASAQAAVASREWSAVKSLRVGDELVVLTRNDVTVKGKLDAVSDAGLTLSRKNKTSSLDRADVRRVYRVKGRSVGRATLIGLGVGTGAGAAVGGVVAATAESTESGEELLPVMVFGAGGAIIGTLAGLTTGLFRRKKRALVYEAP